MKVESDCKYYLNENLEHVDIFYILVTGFTFNSLRSEVFMERDDYTQFWIGLEIRGVMEEVEFELEYKSVTFCLKKIGKSF